MHHTGLRVCECSESGTVSLHERSGLADIAGDFRYFMKSALINRKINEKWKIDESAKSRVVAPVP